MRTITTSDVRRETATVRQRRDERTTIITLGIRIAQGDFGILCQFEEPVILAPTPDCLALYPSEGSLFKCCEGAAVSGVLYATRGLRDRCGCIGFTRFSGIDLAPDCGMGFAVAATLACLRALGLGAQAAKVDMQGWEETHYDG